MHSTAVCAVSRDKDDLLRLAVGIRIVRNVRNVRTGGTGAQPLSRPSGRPLGGLRGVSPLRCRGSIRKLVFTNRGYGGAAPVKAVRPPAGPLHHPRRMDCEARSGFARSDMRDPPSPRLRRTRCTTVLDRMSDASKARDCPQAAAGVFFAVFFSLKRKRA